MNAQFCKIASLSLFIILIAFPASGQNNPGGLELKLQYISSNTWGVYAKPKTDIGSSTITGSGQVTVVMPNGFAWSELESHSGLWMNNIYVSGPSENPTVQYISFGLVQAEPSYPISYTYGEETLLFTFQGNGSCPDFMYLIDCGTPNSSDPFCPPNSVLSNPGNDLSVVEFNGFLGYYSFENIYAPSAWDCHDNDGDGYVNSNEDRNGSGDFDQEDLSDLNDFKSLPLEDGMMLKIQLIEENKWGVFAKPHNVTIDSATLTGAGQVTVVMPNGYDWSGLQSISGLWQYNANVVSPAENPNVQYVSFGLMLAEPNYPIVYHNNEETLLFTFEGNANCPDSLYLIDCGTPFQTDPFCPQNSVNSNPGNDISVIEFNTFPKYYNYVGNYAPSAWSCHDNDGDGIANALEDTNGNGMFDVGIDASDLNTAACNLVIVQQPAGVTACENGEALFISTIENSTGPTGAQTDRQWQIQMANSSVWENLENGIAFNGENIIGGANSDTLLLTPLNGLHNAKVRLMAWTGLCDTVISETANIEVEGPIVFSSQPENATACSGGQVCFSAQAENTTGIGGMEFQWEYSVNGFEWYEIQSSNPTFENSNTPTLCIVDADGLHNTKYRLKARAGACDWAVSAAAQISVEGPIAIFDQPDKVITCAGSSFSFNASANVLNTGNLKYQWQVSSDDVNWSDITASTDGGVYSGFETTNLSVSNSTDLYDRTYRMAAWTDLCGRVYTNPAKVDLEGPFTIIGQPEDVHSCSGTAFFGVDVENLSSDFINDEYLWYQWEESPDGGLTWNELSNGLFSNSGDGVNGVNTDTLSIMEGIHTRYGHQFRVKVWSEFCDPIYSDAAEIVSYIDYAITSSPEDVDLCNGEPAVFSIEMEDYSLGVSNPNNLNVRWQESADNGATYFDLTDSNSGVEGASSTVLQIMELQGRVGHRFRAKVWANGCDTVYSNPAVFLLSSNTDLIVNQQPVSVQACEDDEAVFTVDITSSTSPSNPNLNFQWEILLPGSNNWQEIENLNSSVYIFGGYNSDTLLITPLSDLDGAQVRARAWTDDCNKVISDPALISLYPKIQIISQPQDVVVCTEQNVEFETILEVVGVNQNTFTFIWMANDGINGWVDIPTGTEPSGVTYSNVNTTKLTIKNVNAYISGWRYRLVAINPNCLSTYSSEAKLIVNEIAILEQPSSASVCPGNPHTFQALISSPINSLNYQWQTSTNGSFWTDISEGQSTAMGGQFMGVKTESLHISLVDGLGGHQFRLRSSADQCSATTDAATLTLDTDSTCESTVPYATLGLRLMPNRSTWAVYLKPKEGFTPSGNNKLTGAEVTIAVSQGFSYKNLYSQAGGTWKPTYVLANSPDQPGLSFFTFELTPNNKSLNLTEDGVVLFTFAKNGDCPDVIMLMENDVPAGLHPNYITGTDDGIIPDEPFYFDGLLYYNNKSCKEPVMWETPNNSGDDSLQTTYVQYVQQDNSGMSVTDMDSANGKKTVEQSFYCYPNPAGQTVNIRTNQPFSEGATIRLVNLQGQTLQTHLLNNTSELNLSQLTSGMYFILLEINGVVLQREKLVKK